LEKVLINDTVTDPLVSLKWLMEHSVMISGWGKQVICTIN